MNLVSFYETNKDFKEYVDRYCKQYNEGRSISVHEALTHYIVHEVALQYGSLCS